MENIILSGMLKEFVARHALDGEPSDGQFEMFANYCLLKTDHYDSFDFDKVSTGECIGVDGVAVSIGGVIVDDLEDANRFTSAQFEARFIFAQAKTSSKFDLGDFLKFANTVRLFFSAPRGDIPPELHKAFDIKQMIYEKAAKLRGYPTLELSYVYAGRFDADNAAVKNQIEEAVAAIRAFPYRFSAVSWHVYDGDAIARLYRETQNDIIVDVSFQRHVSLPPIRGARSAYLGVMRCADYVRMIKKENGDLNKGLFFENVRDFLGSRNAVNEDIAKTIHEPDARDRFAILNNGVTIVARSVTPSGDTFRISQFQVVNGCQTSHVLFNNQSGLDPDMYLTVKLIETSDVDLSGQIIATTNSQTQVTKEAFATIRPYHRVLEDFFSAMRGTRYEYYYERRPHQFDDRHDIQQQSIVSAPSLIKSFVSTVLEEPHQVHYYYGNLLSEYNRNETSELFSDDDHPGLYFASHHITARTKGLAGRDRFLTNWAFHLALLIKRMLAIELKKGSSLTDKKFLDLLQRVDDNFGDAFGYAARFLGSLPLHHHENRREDVTRQMLHDFQVHLAKELFVQKPKPGASPGFKLMDGKYVGPVDRVDAATKRVYVQYGPFAVTCDAGDGDVLRSNPGARVAIQVSKGRITAYKIKS